MLLDGVGSGELADVVAVALAEHGRTAVRVPTSLFLRPAGERFEHGREDPEALRRSWLDEGALRREVLDAAPHGRVLPALRDPDRDRSLPAAAVDLPPGGVVLVDGLFLLGRGLPAELTVHIALSPAALRRRGVPDWQRGAFTSYDEEVCPGTACDVLVRAEDPRRPAVRLPHPPPD